jgi:hypothetical protein
MSTKRIAGIVILIAGIAMFLFALNAKHRIAAAKGEAGQMTSYLPDNTAGNFVGNTIRGETTKYDSIVQLLYIGGIVLIVIGGAITIFTRKKR